MSEYAMGYNAYTVGMSLASNPHRDLHYRSQWSKGWLAAKIGIPIRPADCY